jgi:hypothetical protein
MPRRPFLRAWMLALPVVLVAATVPSAAAVPVLFGPQSYERTSGPPDQYSDSFDVPLAVGAIVWIQNGDGDGGDRTSSATVSVNGVQIAGPFDFNRQVDLLAKGVILPKGTTSLTVQMDGDPGSSITVTVMVAGTRPDIAVGRLVLPYADGSGTTLSLHNAARRARRARVVFFDDAGNLVASSDRFDIPAHGSVSKAVSDFITSGSFTSGSIEVRWAGLGAERVFGQATVKDALTGVESIVELQHAGYKRIDPFDPALKFGR